MPTLDVTEVLLDPDFADDIIVIRRTEVTNNYGEPTRTTQRLNVSAVVTNPGPNDLQRVPEYQVNQNAIMVITTFRLRDASQDPKTNTTYSPDLVVYQGSNYVVSALDDYSRYGTGFMEALCIQTDYLDIPAT